MELQLTHAIPTVQYALHVKYVTSNRKYDDFTG